MRRAPEPLLWFCEDPELPRGEHGDMSTERRLDYPDYFTEHYVVVETRKGLIWSILARDAPHEWMNSASDKYVAIAMADEFEEAYDPLGRGTT